MIRAGLLDDDRKPALMGLEPLRVPPDQDQRGGPIQVGSRGRQVLGAQRLFSQLQRGVVVGE